MISFLPRPAIRGYTLTELLITMAIAGATLGVALPLYTGATKSAQQGMCDNQMSAIFQAEEVYRLRNRAYTTNLADLNGMPGIVTQCPCASAGSTQRYTLNISSLGGITVSDTCGMHIAGKRRQTSDGVTFLELNCQ